MRLHRREFLKTTLAFGSSLFLGSCRSRLSEEGGLIRPPGALPEREFRSACIGCNACVNLCHSLKYSSLAIAAGWRDFGTPYVKDMRDYPCTLCMECPKHCPTRALRPIPMEEARMGMALIDLGLCLGWNGDVCLSCSKACPMGAVIFDFFPSDWGNQPYINENCKGCGLCVKHCPVGTSAVKVVTWESYGRLKAAYRSETQGVLRMGQEERYVWVYDRNLPKILEAGRIIEREFR